MPPGDGLAGPDTFRRHRWLCSLDGFFRLRRCWSAFPHLRRQRCEARLRRCAKRRRATPPAPLSSVNLARDAAIAAVAATNLKNAVKALEKTDKGDDATADAYVLGSALSLWANQPGVGLTPKRGAVGFTTNPDARSTSRPRIDSLFKIVEAAQPGLLRLHRVLARRTEVLPRSS